MFTQIKLYFSIAVAAVIIGLLVWVGIEKSRVAALTIENRNLKEDNQLAWAEVEVQKNKITIIEHYAEAEEQVRLIDNTNALDPQTQIAVNSILDGYYK